MRAGVREVPPSPGRGAVKPRREPHRLQARRRNQAGKGPGLHAVQGRRGAHLPRHQPGLPAGETKIVLLIDLNLQFGDALSFVTTRAALAHRGRRQGTSRRLDACLLARAPSRWTPNFSVLAAPEDLPTPWRSSRSTSTPSSNWRCSSTTSSCWTCPHAGHHCDQGAGPGLAHLPRCCRRPARLRNAHKLLEAFKFAGLSAGQDRADRQPLRQEQRDRHRPGAAFRCASRSASVPTPAKEVTASINHGEPLADQVRTNSGRSRQIVELAQAESQA